MQHSRTCSSSPRHIPYNLHNILTKTLAALYRNSSKVTMESIYKKSEIITKCQPLSSHMDVVHSGGDGLCLRCANESQS